MAKRIRSLKLRKSIFPVMWLQVAFHRACADADHRGGFLVAFSSSQQLYNFRFAGRKRRVIVVIVVSGAGVANKTFRHARGKLLFALSFSGMRRTPV